MSKIHEVCAAAIHAYPDHSIRALASLVYNENPELFISYESARNAIRYRKGKLGAQARADAKTKHKDTMTTKQAERSMPMPKSKAKPRKPYKLPQGKTLILADVHVPYHDDKALDVALEFGDSYEPDNILLNGDQMDFFSISRWEKDPKLRNLSGELQAGRQFIQALRERYPNAQIIWKNGNHEERWEHYLWHKAPELCGSADFELERILRFSEYGVQFVHGRQIIRAGKNLTIIHGHEVMSAADPVNFARTLYTKMGVCTMGGHKHKTSEHSEKHGNDKFVTCWSIGTLQEMHPEYAVLNKWNHGIATVELDGNDFTVQNYRIINGKVV